MDLKDKRCVPCPQGTPPLDKATVAMLISDVMGWELRSGTEEGAPQKLGKRFTFDDFLGSMAFVDKMAALAEEQEHHPDFCVRYSEVDVVFWTHTVGGLSENDFIMASKIDAMTA
jgi:4a-hydroxytetrahydrobiopterin dehydratase